MTWESTLLVKDIQTKDYGSYECIARNELSDERHTIRLDVTSAPEPPVGFHVVNFTHDSVTLSWIPGFDGGYEQSYKVRYIRVGSDNARFVEVFPKNITVFTVTQLALGTEYAFSISAQNVVGESNYTTESVRQETSSKPDFISRNNDFCFSNFYFASALTFFNGMFSKCFCFCMTQVKLKTCFFSGY